MNKEVYSRVASILDEFTPSLSDNMLDIYGSELSRDMIRRLLDDQEEDELVGKVLEQEIKKTKESKVNDALLEDL